jgi:hypothetical protein
MSRAKIDPARSGAYMHGGTGTALLEIEVRDDQQGEKKQGVYDEQHAEAGVSPGEVGDAVRNQSNTKTKIGKLLYFERDIRYQKRQHSQYFCGRKLHLEVLWQSQMDERSFRSIGERKMIVKDKIDDAKYHDGTDYRCCRPVNYSLSIRELFAGCCHDVLLVYNCRYAQYICSNRRLNCFGQKSDAN